MKVTRSHPVGRLSPEQYEVLRKPLNATRIAKRSQGGKQLSYLESWEVRAHLIRVFGYTGFDSDLIDYAFVGQRDYESKGDDPKPMVEIIYSAKMRLVVRDREGVELCHYTEGAVGSASGPASMLGEHHDNALKTAASDALKRCAINLGTQFGLSLYDNGSTRDVVKKTLAPPVGYVEQEPTEEQIKQLQHSLGATVVDEGASA
jgi:recombination DNA repair RAD52 pathway protein